MLILLAISRGEATRTPDLYVPNVARYQLRYTPSADCECKVNIFIRFIQIFRRKNVGKSMERIFYIFYGEKSGK